MAALFSGCCGVENKEEEDAKRIGEYARKSQANLWNAEAGVALLAAAHAGDLAKVKAEIGKGADINKAETNKGSPKFGRTALIWAIEHGDDTKLLEWLVSQPECQLNVFKFGSKEGAKKSALLVAVAYGGTPLGVDKVRIMLSQPERIVLDPLALECAKKFAAPKGAAETWKTVISLLEKAQAQQGEANAEADEKSEADAMVTDGSDTKGTDPEPKAAAVQPAEKTAEDTSEKTEGDPAEDSTVDPTVDPAVDDPET